MNIVEEIKKLNLPAGEFAVFGSGPMLVRGMRQSNDVDIIVTERLFMELQKDSSWTVQQMRDHHAGLKRGNLEIYYTWAPGAWDVNELIRDADMIDGVPFVKLDAVVEWKTLRNEKKDADDIRLIEEYTKAHPAA